MEGGETRIHRRDRPAAFEWVDPFKIMKIPGKGFLRVRRSASSQEVLEATLAAQRLSVERMEVANRRLEEFFAATSDGVFLFVGDDLESANTEAREILRSAGSSGTSLLAILRETRDRKGADFPIPLELSAANDERLCLSIRNSRPLSLQDETGLLVTVQNQTRMRKLTEEGSRAAEEERRIIGRNLHDGLSQLLTSLSLQVHAFASSETDPRQKERLAEISRQTRAILAEGSAFTNELEES